MLHCFMMQYDGFQRESLSFLSRELWEGFKQIICCPSHLVQPSFGDINFNSETDELTACLNGAKTKVDQCCWTQNVLILVHASNLIKLYIMVNSALHFYKKYYGIHEGLQLAAVVCACK